MGSSESSPQKRAVTTENEQETQHGPIGFSDSIISQDESPLKAMQSSPSSVWFWASAIIGSFIGNEIGQYTGFLAAQAAGVSRPDTTPYVAALVKGHQDGGAAGRFLGGVAALIAAYICTRYGYRWVSAVIGIGVGAVVGAIAGYIVCSL